MKFPLAKWLRIMGYDTAYAKEGNDNEIITKADEEKRILLTRDKELHSRYKNSVFIDSTELEKQIKKVIISLNIKINEKNYLSRCTVCNTPVIKISKNEVNHPMPMKTMKNSGFALTANTSTGLAPTGKT